jgi:hypothetical protein
MLYGSYTKPGLIMTTFIPTLRAPSGTFDDVCDGVGAFDNDGGSACAAVDIDLV